jgi:hypothetical protein
MQVKSTDLELSTHMRNVSDRQIRRRLKKLKDLNYIKVDNDFINGYTERTITIITKAFNQSVKPTKSKFTPPSKEEFIAYFIANDFSEADGIKAFDSYANNNWKDANDNKIVNWKSKLINGWFKYSKKVVKPGKPEPPKKSNSFDYDDYKRQVRNYHASCKALGYIPETTFTEIEYYNA